MLTMVDIVVVIVNWNAREDLRQCLQSLYAAPKPSLDFAVWVVDNASDDGSVPMVQREFPQANLIINPENVGFSKANNQVIRASKSRYVFLLNSDAMVHAGALDALAAFADARPEAGILGPQVRNPDGSLQFSCRRFPNLGAGFFRNTYLGRLFPNNRFARNYLMGDVDHARSRAVDWVSGCAMLIRRDLINTVGVLDERFFMFCEDVDICWRCWLSGQQVWYAPTATVTHAIGGSSERAAEKVIKDFHHSWYEFDKKRNPGFRPLRRMAVAAGLGLRAAVRILKRRRAARHSQVAVLPPVVEATRSRP